MDSRARLLTAAREVLDADGPSGVTIREVARRAGVSHGAPRRYFPARIDLLAALAHEGFGQLIDRLGAATADLSARERLVRATTEYVAFAHEHPGLFELMFRHDLLADSGHRLREVSLPLLARWQDWFVAAYPDVPIERATVLWVSVHGVAVLGAHSTLDLVGADPATLIALAIDAAGGG